MGARQEAVERFQGDPVIRLFCGNMQAAGVGITLTASSHVVFGELDWVPATLSQAEDRTHRIGQHADNVLIQHLVLEGSLDAIMAQRVIDKQKLIDQALDNKATHQTEVSAESYEIQVEKEESAVSKISRKEILSCATFTQQQTSVIHLAIKAVSALCDGAHSTDHKGFSRMDVQVGHSLSQCSKLSQKQTALSFKLAWRYRAQLPEGMVEELKKIKDGT